MTALSTSRAVTLITSKCAPHAAGRKILVSTGGEKEYHCAVSDFPEGEVLAAVEEVTAADRELPSGIVLFQGLPKGDKMELIIQKQWNLVRRKLFRWR